MSDSKTSRLSRLAAIQTMLQAKQLLTARAVAEKFDISLRTVYRDMRALEQAGVPICTEEGRGYSLVAGYTLPPVTLSQREANALITAERLVARNKDTSFVRDYEAAITKIKAILRRGTQEKAELLAQRVVFRDNPRSETSSDTLAVLQLAITHHTPVAMHYQALSSAKVGASDRAPRALQHPRQLDTDRLVSAAEWVSLVSPRPYSADEATR